MLFSSPVVNVHEFAHGLGRADVKSPLLLLTRVPLHRDGEELPGDVVFGAGASMTPPNGQSEAAAATTRTQNQKRSLRFFASSTTQLSRDLLPRINSYALTAV